MMIRVLCFAQVKEAVGEDVASLAVPDGATAEKAAFLLLDSAGASNHLRSLPFRFAVNGEFCPGWTLLKEGDELAPLPPVAGG